MDAFFKLLLSGLTISILIGCDNDRVEVPKAPPFEEREVLQVLNDEPGRIEYYCDGDTTFIYLSTDAENLPNLILDDETDLNQNLNLIFDDLPQLYGGWCLAEPQLQDPNIAVLINGNLMGDHQFDSFPQKMGPFDLETMRTYKSCLLDSIKESVKIDSVFGRWQIYRMVLNDSVYIPPCEYNKMTIDFTKSEYLNRGPLLDGNIDSVLYEFDGDLHINYCSYYFQLRGKNKLYLEKGPCILGFIASTWEIRQFVSAFDQITNINNSFTIVNYQITNNWLTIFDNQGNRIELFRTE